jgi:hypothetical protein
VENAVARQLIVMEKAVAAASHIFNDVVIRLLPSRDDLR